MVQHIADFLNKYASGKLIIACSAGIDSTVLLHACHQLDFEIEIAHVNYQLRGEESELDAKFLEDLAASMKIPFHLKVVDLSEKLKNGGNLQELARIERYDFFESLIEGNPLAFILLAHHREDQTETFFMNLARNSGIPGLSAMPERRGNYLRPMLHISKSDLYNYTRENELKWREDSSNASTKYTRNKWRNDILPELRTKIPELDKSIGILVQAFQEKQSELEQSIRPIHGDILRKATLSASVFDHLDEFEQIEVCRQLVQPLGVLETWKKLNHKGTFVLLKSNECCPFDRIVFEGDSYSFVADKTGILPKILMEEVSILPSTFNKSEIYLDDTKIQGSLKVRRVRTGDRIKPVGMKGSKLVSDIISDAKLNSFRKQELVVLTDDSQILWVPELCVSRMAIATSTSAKILKVRLLIE